MGNTLDFCKDFWNNIIAACSNEFRELWSFLIKIDLIFKITHLSMYDYMTQQLKSFEDSFIDDDGQTVVLGYLLLRGIFGYDGFSKPTKIQSSALVPLCLRRDIIVQAGRGTGKTSASVIAALHRIDWNQHCVQVVIVHATLPDIMTTTYNVHKLGACYDVGYDNRFLEFGKCEWLLECHHRQDRGRVDEQASAILDGRIKMIVGTFGRIAELLRLTSFASTVKLLIVDNADFVLDRFYLELNDIIKHMPHTTQLAFFSEMMPESLLTVARSLVRPDRLAVEVLLSND